MPENDNGAIDAVCTAFAAIADETQIGIDLIHHVRKTNGAEITVEDGRGAVALLSAVRSARALNPMSQDEAEKASGINSREHFRVTNGKLSMAPPPPDRSDWYRLNSVPLGNDEALTGPYPLPIDNGDNVQVVTTWQWPDLMQGVQASDIGKVQAVIEAGRWRENHQAKDWAGRAVAQVLKLDLAMPADKKKVLHVLKTWIGSGMLVIIEGEDEKRNKRSYVEVGERATD